MNNSTTINTTTNHTTGNDSEVEGFLMKPDDLLGVAAGRRQHLPIVSPRNPTVPGFITPESGQDLWD